MELPHLDLVRNDRAAPQFFANFVHPIRVKVAQSQVGDLALALEVLEVMQGGEVPMIIVVLPVKLIVPQNGASKLPSRHFASASKLTCRRSTHCIFIRSSRSLTAASTSALVGSIFLNTHHLVAPKIASG